MKLHWVKSPPPYKRTRPTEYGAVLEELRKHPGRWAILRIYNKVESAHAGATRLRARLGYKLFEFVVRQGDKRQGVVYGRARRK